MFRTFFRSLTVFINTESRRLINIPDWLIGYFVFMSANAILQAVADVVLEGLVLAQMVPFKLPFRLEFLFLTMLSTVIAYLTLQGIKKGDLDVTRNTLIIGILVELSLLIGDIYLLFNTTKNFWTLFAVRSPFMFFTSLNVFIIAYFMWMRYRMKKNRPNYRF